MAQFAGSNREILTQLLTRAALDDPSFVVFVGDLIDGYVTEPRVFQWQLDA